MAIYSLQVRLTLNIPTISTQGKAILVSLRNCFVKDLFDLLPLFSLFTRSLKSEKSCVSSDFVSSKVLSSSTVSSSSFSKISSSANNQNETHMHHKYITLIWSSLCKFPKGILHETDGLLAPKYQCYVSCFTLENFTLFLQLLYFLPSTSFRKEAPEAFLVSINSSIAARRTKSTFMASIFNCPGSGKWLR